MGEGVVSGVGWSTPANTWRYTPVISLLLYFVLQVYKYKHLEIHTGNISPLVFCLRSIQIQIQLQTPGDTHR